MEECACVDFNNRCDEHKDLVIGPNILTGNSEPLSQIPVNEFYETFLESSQVKETDAMGREIFWEDLGRPNV